MPEDLAFWHARYSQQVGWSLQARRYIFRKINLPKSAPVLEIGSGTGALLQSLRADGYTRLSALDIHLDALLFSRDLFAVCADAHHLPFRAGSFTMAIFHYLLLWVADPAQVLREMSLAVAPGGWVAALSEPDYHSRVDQPAGLAELGRLQTNALADQCVDVGIGARLVDLFNQAGLVRVETGVIRQEFPKIFKEEDFELEWSVLRCDLAGCVPEKQIQQWYDLDRLAAVRGESRHYVPVHFAFGRKPGA